MARTTIRADGIAQRLHSKAGTVAFSVPSGCPERRYQAVRAGCNSTFAAPNSSSFCFCPVPLSVRHTCGPPVALSRYKLARGPWLGFTTSLLIPVRLPRRGPSRWASTHREGLEGTLRPRPVALPRVDSGRPGDPEELGLQFPPYSPRLRWERT